MMVCGRTVGLLCGLLLTVGCVSSGRDVAPSGFLSSYVGLNEAGGAFDQVYVKPAATLSEYESILVEPVEVVIDPEAEYKGFDPDEVSALASYFENALIEAVKDAYTVATEPGPGVLRLRAAITHLKPGKPGRNLLTTVSPAGLVTSSVKRAVTGSHLFVGEASIEAELLDAETNERLLAAVDHEAGKKHQVGRGTSEWGHVKAIFGSFAAEFRALMDGPEPVAGTE